MNASERTTTRSAQSIAPTRCTFMTKPHRRFAVLGGNMNTVLRAILAYAAWGSWKRAAAERSDSRAGPSAHSPRENQEITEFGRRDGVVHEELVEMFQTLTG
jgi:hypothetical protein